MIFEEGETRSMSCCWGILEPLEELEGWLHVVFIVKGEVGLR